LRNLNIVLLMLGGREKTTKGIIVGEGTLKKNRN
jgi:hypothetical protein